MTFLLVTGIALLLVLVIFSLTMLLSAKKAKREKGKTPLYSERCGGSLGFIGFSIPFVRITFYEDFFVISCWSRTVIEYNKIKRLRNSGRWGFSFEIITYYPSKYGQPTIWSLNKNYILNLLKKQIKKHRKKQTFKSDYYVRGIYKKRN